MKRQLTFTGIVVKGLNNGTKLGYPTANIEISPKTKLPKLGVYAAIALINNKQYQGIANVGIHPTINQLATPVIEIHLLSFKENIYNQTIEIKLLKYLRKEQKFASIKALAAQIELDKKAVKSLKL